MNETTPSVQSRSARDTTRFGGDSIVLEQAPTGAVKNMSGEPHEAFESMPARATPGPAAAGPGMSLRRALASALLKAAGNPPISIEFVQGMSIAGQEDVVATIKVRDGITLLKLFLRPELTFGDAYMDGSAEVEGSLVKLLEVCARARSRVGSTPNISRIARVLDVSRANSVNGSRENIHHHYDLGNDFYRLWLDKEMVYTCAYFPTKQATLEEAQAAKLDLVCRKLQLRGGERVVEAGCGWGAFALYAASRYGVRVQAFNISREQIAFARDRARALGVQDRVEFIDDDYRNISGRYDAFVSIGMLEHVGREHYVDLGRVIDRCLSDSGRGLIHSIGQDRPTPLNPWIVKRIFPGAYPPTLREMIGIIEPWQFTVLDVENLRPHYALTLEHWLKRFEDNRDRVRELYGEPFVRAWRFYLSGSTAAFKAGDLQLFQVLFNRSGLENAAWTRDHLNCNAAE